MSVADEIKKLVDLRNQGEITKAEYKQLKAVLLGSRIDRSLEGNGTDGERRSRQNPWQPSELVAVLRAASVGNARLTIQRYSDLRKAGVANGPSPAIFINSFGSWSAACSAAGIRSGKPLRTNYVRRWSNEDLLRFVVEYVRANLETSEKPGTAKGIEMWLRSLGASRDAPSLATLRNRLGSWLQMRDAAMNVIEQEAQERTNPYGRWLSSTELSDFDPTELMETTEVADLGGVDADLIGANLRGADLGLMRLVGAALIEADLEGAYLRRTDLRGADLSRANLRGANLEGANLEGADLFGADLFGAKLGRANLTGADLTEADLRQAEADHYTTWPKGFDPKAAGVIFD